NDPQWKITLRILRLLRSGRDGVESNVREENIRSTEPYALGAEWREAVPIAAPVGGVHILKSEADYKEHHGNFNHHDDRVEARALSDSNRQNDRDNKRYQKRWKIESYFDAKYFRGVQQNMGALYEIRRMHGKNVHALVQKGLCARNKSGIGSLGHLARHDFFRSTQCGPVVISQPKRHFDMKNVEQLNEMVGPSRRHGACAHGVFQRQIPANNPGE